jgi:outer membrane protein TolC
LAGQDKKISIAVKNGYLLKSNQLVLESEILTTEQRIVEIDAAITNLVKELSTLTGLAIDPASNFELPSEIALVTDINRPELKVYASQINVLNNQVEVLKRDNLPKLFVFGTGAYGRPGYNFLDVDMRLYGIIGAGINYNLNNLFVQKNKINSADLNISSLQRQKETFNMNLEISLSQKQTDIEKYKTIISKDKEIVLKRQEILREYASQLENGAITSTEYLTELNATNNAELNLLLHSVQKNITETQYNLLTGN